MKDVRLLCVDALWRHASHIASNLASQDSVQPVRAPSIFQESSPSGIHPEPHADPQKSSL